MTKILVTKYNPKYRTSDGVYTGDEWTSVSDIGKSFSDGALTVETYLEAENAYVESAQTFFKINKITSMKITYIESNGPKPKILKTSAFAIPSLDLIDTFQVGVEINCNLLENLVRLNLREACWTKLEGPDGSYVHFGYDYYMFLGTNRNISESDLKTFPQNVFIEEVDSPFHDEN